MKAQVTTFVIIGFVLLLFVSTLLILTSTTELSIFQSSISINKKIDELKADLTHCIRQEVVNAIKAGNASIVEQREIICDYTAHETENYAITQEGRSSVQVEERERGILLTINYPLIITQGESSTRLEPYQEFLSYETRYDISLFRGMTTTQQELHSIGEIARILIPEETQVSNRELTVTSNVIGEVTISNTTFTPWAALTIYQPNVSHDAILDVRENTTLISVRIQDQLTTQITQGGSYKTVSCKEHACCWNGKCDDSENYQTCGECEAPTIPEIAIREGTTNTTSQDPEENEPPVAEEPDEPVITDPCDDPEYELSHPAECQF